jgi:hypothetical protein
MTILPLIGTIQWLDHLSDTLTGYLYGGLIYPYVGSNVGGTVTQLQKIQVPAPAIGAGLYIQTGPNWFVRVNLGIEAMTAGVMLRF